MPFCKFFATLVFAWRCYRVYHVRQSFELNFWRTKRQISITQSLSSRPRETSPGTSLYARMSAHNSTRSRRSKAWPACICSLVEKMASRCIPKVSVDVSRESQKKSVCLMWAHISSVIFSVAMPSTTERRYATSRHSSGIVQSRQPPNIATAVARTFPRRYHWPWRRMNLVTMTR